MLRIISTLVVTAALALAVLTTASGSNVHFKAKGGPSYTDGGLTLSVSASITGLGNENVLVTLAATANPTGSCTNPAGETKPPGHQPAPVDVTGSVAIPANKIKNGNLSFSVATQPPTTPIPGAPDCPNTQWTEDITDMAFTSATLTVEQPAGTVVLQVACAFSAPTSNGAVPAGNVTCS